MLTEIDVHYLVGLLTQVAETKDVDIELGSRVYDEAAEEKRDVDITVKYKSEDGATHAFFALEVKGELIQIKAAKVTGEVIRVKSNLKTEFKVLKKVGDQNSYIGCLITELSNGTRLA